MDNKTKIKYYLRGIGAGILLSLLLFSLFTPKKTVSDEDVIKRATELGYVKNTDKQYFDQLKKNLNEESKVETTPVVTEIPQATETPVPSASVQNTPSVAPENTPAVTPEVTNTPLPTSVPAVSPSVTPTAEPTGTPSITPAVTVTPEVNEENETDITEVNVDEEILTDVVVITRKMFCSDAVMAIYEKGLIDDPQELIDYMVEHKLEKKVRSGSYTISSDMTYEMIAAIITKTNR